MSTEISVKPSAFGWFERFTAGFCMAIPVLLITAEMEVSVKKWICLAVTLLVVAFLPVIAPWALKQVERKNHGRWITGLGAIMLLAFTFVAVEFNFSIRKSISSYVVMTDGHIFGMLLSVASMLFIANGFVYKNEQTLKEAGFRKWLNIVSGLLLLGVVVFRCDKSYVVHMVFAISFIVFCMIGTVKRRKGSNEKDGKPIVETSEEKKKKRAHAFWDFAPIVAMAVTVFFWLAGANEWLPWPWLKHVTLFGVESMALWIVGADFILISLKREKVG